LILLGSLKKERRKKREKEEKIGGNIAERRAMEVGGIRWGKHSTV